MQRFIYMLVMLVFTSAFPLVALADDTGGAGAQTADDSASSGESAVDTFIDPNAPFPDKDAGGTVTDIPTGSDDATGQDDAAPSSGESAVDTLIDPYAPDE